MKIGVFIMVIFLISCKKSEDPSSVNIDQQLSLIYSRVLTICYDDLDADDPFIQGMKAEIHDRGIDRKNLQVSYDYLAHNPKFVTVTVRKMADPGAVAVFDVGIPINENDFVSGIRKVRYTSFEIKQ